MMSGDDLETFTIAGWGWGLLQADLVEPFLLQFFALSAHAYTRGTFVAPESSLLDRSKVRNQCLLQLLELVLIRRIEITAKTHLASVHSRRQTR